MKTGLVDSELESSTGDSTRVVRRSRPISVLFIMQTALETMKWPEPKPEFRTCKNGVTMGERIGRKRGTVPRSNSGVHCVLISSELFFSTTPTGAN